MIKLIFFVASHSIIVNVLDNFVLTWEDSHLNLKFLKQYFDLPK